MKIPIITMAIFVASTISAQAQPERQVQVKSIDFDANTIELFNFATTDFDLAGWRFCSHDSNQQRQYTAASGFNGVVIEAGTSVIIHFDNDAPAGDADRIDRSTLGGAFAEPLSSITYGLQLFAPIGGPVNFGNSSQIADHIQWLQNGSNPGLSETRTQQAVSEGLWPAVGDFIGVSGSDADAIVLTDLSGDEIGSPDEYETRRFGGPTFVVTNTNDSGPGSLRAAVAAADEMPDGNGIIFDASLEGATITLTGGEIQINSSIEILGPGAGLLTIDAGGNSRIFRLADPTIDFFDRFEVVISGLRLTGGSADEGGAIENYTRLDVIGCDIDGNTANFGAAIFTGSTSLFVADSLIRNNTGNDGVVIFGDEAGGTLNNVTVTGNTAGTNGVLFFAIGAFIGSFDVENSTIVFNDAFVLREVGETERSFFQNCAFGFNNNPPGVQIGFSSSRANFLGGDPMLGPLQDNGGPTLTFAPLTGSPLIDAGDNDSLDRDENDIDRDFDITELIEFDQRGTGFPRIVNGTIDIGATEVQSDMAFEPGDMNCDGAIDLLDVAPFVLAILNPDEFGDDFPDCVVELADINQDGFIDLLDVQPFIDIVVG